MTFLLLLRGFLLLNLGASGILEVVTIEMLAAPLFVNSKICRAITHF